VQSPGGAAGLKKPPPDGATPVHVGRIIWRMDPKQEKKANNPAPHFGAISSSRPRTGRRASSRSTDKETGKIVWETNMSFGETQLRITAAPLAIKDRIIVGASGGDSGVRDWIAGLDAATGKVLWRKFTIPAPGQRNVEGQEQRLADRRCCHVGDRHL
jgi:alcohol dehydrogenase (cytochrome c)